MTTNTPLRIEWTFDAPVERVYNAWVRPEHFAKWAWGTIGIEPEATIDARSGGGFTVTTKTKDGGTCGYIGRYTDVVPNERLAFGITWDAPMGYEAPNERATVAFAPADNGGTRMTFLHEGVPGGIAVTTHDAGWRNTFETLERLLTE